MFFWNSYPFVRLGIVLILGIICFDQTPSLWKYPFWVLLACSLCYAASIFISHKFSFYKLRHLNGILALFTIFWIGGYLTKINYHNHGPSHYKNLLVSIQGFSGTVISPTNDRTNHYRYEFQLNHIIAEDSLIFAKGKLHLYVRKDSFSTPLNYGDKLRVFGNFFPISEPGNPDEFDYKQYLARQNIYAHAFVTFEDLEVVRKGSLNPSEQWAYQLRNRASQTIDRHITQSRENGIAKALLLGIKDHLDNELKKAYSAAGAMHVLAVSGLHVGIIFLLIKFAFGRLKKMGRWGNYVFGSLSVATIWVYAIVTGLSPSVLRAATMFSVVALSEASTRETNIYNSLGLAAFILLLFNPYLIYSVGFQLSFAAVIGIVYLQPKLYRLVEFQFFLVDKAWAITCVSLAAQLSTFPLTAYYFHQFPTYFLLSNLLVIPASFLILLGGLLMLISDAIDYSIGNLIGTALQKIIWLTNELISYTHSLPYSLIEWIYLDFFGLILIYTIVITLIVGLHFGVFRTLIVSTLLVLLLSCSIWMEHELQSQKRELVFYELKDKTAIDYIQGHTAKLITDSYTEKEIELLSFQVNPYRLSSHLNPLESSITTFDELGFLRKDVIRIGKIANKKILLIDSTTFHLEFIQKVKADYIIINNGSIKSLEWLEKNFQFEGLIIGTKNSRFYSMKMKAQAKELGIEIHSLNEDGALIIPLE